MNRRKVPWGLVLFAGLVVVPGADGHEEKKYLGWEHKWGVGSAYSSEQDDCLVRYNRVEGLFLGAREPLSYHTDHTGQGFAGYGHLGYGFGAREWQYQVGIEEFSFHGSPRSLSSIGAELHDVTTSQDTWLLSAEENSLYAALFRRDFFDYYQRRGWSVYTIHDYAGLVHLTARWSQDEFSSLDSQVDWIPVGNRLARKTFRVNPAVDEGKANSLRLDIQVDNRDHRRWHRREWLVNSMVEQGGGRLGGDFTFRRVLLEMRRYLEDGESELDLRLRLGRGSGELPRQYLYNLGGYSTLRGYPHKAFSGDRMALLNIEYWHDDIGVFSIRAPSGFPTKGPNGPWNGALLNQTSKLISREAWGLPAALTMISRSAWPVPWMGRRRTGATLCAAAGLSELYTPSSLEAPRRK